MRCVKQQARAGTFHTHPEPPLSGPRAGGLGGGRGAPARGWDLGFPFEGRGNCSGSFKGGGSSFGLGHSGGLCGTNEGMKERGEHKKRMDRG